MSPSINQGFDPCRNRHSAQLITLSANVNDAPPAVALRQVLYVKADQLLAAQPGADKHGQQRTIALAFERRIVWRVDQRLSISLGQPIAGAHATSLNAFDLGQRFSVA